MACLTNLKKKGGSMQLAGPTDFVREVLQVTHLDQVIPIFATEAEALHVACQEGGETSGSGETG